MSFEPHPSVVCTVIDDGGVLLHLDTKFYYSLNATALVVWDLLEAGHADPDVILGDGNGRADGIRAFLDELARESLVRAAASRPAGAGNLPGGMGAANGAGAAPPSPALPGGTWIAPRLTRHDIPLNQILSNPFDPSVPLAE
ncbi:MAG TPA: PqqD family protein [Candidatus Eisenbacteria bacterium]